jgi:RNA polymerase Rpb3/Rpb11 dimerisation domain
MAYQINSQIPSAEIIDFQNEDQLDYGKFAFSGLRKGQGITVANALRRVLLYDIQGIGITSFHIFEKSKKKETTGFEYKTYTEFSSIPQFRESVLEIAQNLSGIICGFSVDKKNLSNQPIVASRRFSLDLCLKENLSGLKFTSFDGYTTGDEAGLLKQRNSTEVPIFILKAKHLFDPKFWILDMENSETNSSINEQISSSQMEFSPQSPRKRVDSISENSDEGENWAIRGNSTENFIECFNPDHEIASLFLMGNSKKGFEYPDLSVDFTIGRLSHIQLRTEHMGENPGGIKIGGSFSNTLLESTDGNLHLGGLDTQWVTCGNETNFFPIKRVNYTVQEKNSGEEEVFLEIWTNRSISPKNAINQALNKLIEIFRNFTL